MPSRSPTAQSTRQSSPQPDVIVVGAGVIGCSVAWHLARRGVRVRVLERDGVGAHASGAAVGMLAPICESEERDAFFRIGLRALARFAEPGAETEPILRAARYVPSGIARIADSDAQAEELRARCATLADLDVRWLDPADLAARVPGLAPGIRGALWSPREGHVNSAALTGALHAAAAAAGAEFRAGAEITALACSRDGVSVHVNGSETVSADRLVNCTGAWAGCWSEWIKCPIPVRPVRGQALGLELPEPAFRPIVWGNGIYLVPRPDGELVVGATVEETGFDCKVTAGGLSRLLSGAEAILPGTVRCGFRRAWAGLRPGSADGLPLIGAVPGQERVLLAAGHYRNGVLLSLLTGEWVAGLVLGVPAAMGAADAADAADAVDAAAVSPGRFGRGGAGGECAGERTPLGER